MDLIEIYIQEVTRRLPEKNREDIALELRSTIEDMLPDDYQEDDVKEVLEKLGNPAKLAYGYKDRPMHLIGPRFFDIYVSLLKMILPIAATISVISLIAEFFIGYNGEEAIMNVVFDMIGFGIARIIEVAIQTFFWLTIVFAIIERVDYSKGSEPATPGLKKWTVDDLKHITYIPKKKAITKVEVFGGLLWTAIWATVYFYADHLFGIYEGGSGELNFVTPALNQDVLLQYWPIVFVMVVLEVGLAIYKLVKKQWTKGLAIYNTVLQFISSAVFILIVTNPNLFKYEFILYLAELFSIKEMQIETWIIGSAIFFFILSAGISVVDGIRKARAR
ncbi:HAAS signaling domain-containing protein [Mesobacillus maritimus]|uniref:HAAS signaling domain-containing protein n=1 Tax=Mesobacillus maritimus TaxID=1643336 RepID=UPI00384CEB8E